MIIAPHFAIGHIGRTGGDTVTTMVMEMALMDGGKRTQEVGGSVDHPTIKITPLDKNEKHATFQQHGISPGDQRTRILVIRRLPSYLLALKHFADAHGLHPYHKGFSPVSVQQMVSPHAAYGDSKFHETYGTTFSKIPDVFMGQMLIGNIKIDKWIRQETLREDFINLVPFLLGREAPPELVKLLSVKRTKPCLQYEHDWTKWFTEKEVEQMYSNNPVWTKCELEAYGEPLKYEYVRVDTGPQ